MKLKEQLEALYASKWNELCDALKTIIESEEQKIKPASPLLISGDLWEPHVLDEIWYTKADIKVMVFGQETNGWAPTMEDESGTSPSPVFDPEIALTEIIATYENVYASFYDEVRFSFNDRPGTFFYGFTKFMSLLKQAFPDKKLAYIWNNIVKIGKSEGRGFPGGDIYGIERRHFSVIPEEIAIIKPDIILFLTGTYDNKIRDVFGETTFVPLGPTGGVAKVMLPSVKLAYRTYHPCAHLGKGVMIQNYQTIIEDIRTSLKEK